MGAWDFLRRWLSRWDECAGRGLCAKAGHLSALRRPPLRSGAGPDKCGAFAVHFETATDQKILRRRRPVPTLAAASRGGAESCAQGRAKCVQACTFVGREPPVRPKIRRRTVWICRSRRCGHHKVRHVTLGPVSGRALHHSAWPSLVTFPEQRCTIAGPRSWAALHALRLADYVVHSTGAVCYQ